MKSLCLVLLLIIDIELIYSQQFGRAIFNNTRSGIEGTMTLLPTMGSGSYLIAQIQNITCANSTSATLNRSEVAFPNFCRLGVTINNLLQNTPANESLDFRPFFNISTVNLPNIASIWNSSRIGANLFPTAISKPLTGNCENIGSIFNPLGNDTTEPMFNPGGVKGNMMVNRGTGTMIMGPLELLLAGPQNMYGLPIVVWMDAIHPNNTYRFNGNSDRMLGCSTIMPVNEN